MSQTAICSWQYHTGRKISVADSLNNTVETVLDFSYPHAADHMFLFWNYLELRLATAYWDATHKTVLLKDGVLEKEGDAYGFFNDSLSNTGWGVLELRAGYGKTQETDDVTYFLAGYLEGFLTAE